MAQVKIDIASEFTGKKAFKEAETSTDKLTKGVKRLGGALALTFSARGIGQAVKAFAEDDKAAKALGQTLNNLGLAFGSNSATVNGYISRLEKQTGVLDDELRPAMDRFLRSTLSVSKSQELLNLALDISAGTGKSLTQVSQSLQKAYLGQTQALGRLGVGLSKAELTSASFEEIQQRLAVLFAGQASTAASTYAGEMAKLQVAVNNAKETIGQGFVDALKTASGSSTVDPIISAIDKIARAFNYVTAETAKFIAITKTLGSFDLFFKDPTAFQGVGNISMSVSSQDTQKAELATRKAAERAAAAQAAKLAALQKATLKTQKDALKLAKARAVFDLEKIQIEAALKGKISEEDRIRLNLMKAILNENVSDIEKYQKALKEAQEKTKELTDLLATVKALELKDPFSLWKVDPLTASINDLTKSMFAVQTQIQANGREWSSFTSAVAATSLKGNMGEWNSSFAADSAANKAAMEAALAAAKANAEAIAAANKAAQEGFGAQTKAAQEAAAAQIKAQQEAAAAQIAAITAGSAEQKAALEAQLKAQSEALAAQAKAQMEALQKRLADEAAAYKEAAEAAAAAAEAALLTGANDYTTAALAKIASEAAAQAAAAQAAEAAAAQATASTSTGGTTKIEVTVTGDPFSDPNAVAEKVVEIIRSASNRGTVDVLGFE
jgi:hypothetical protein